MNFLYYFLSFFVTINIVVFVHEYGHYLAARAIGVKITKFSIGIGPEIFGINDKHGTRWCFSWLPIGGYVMMFGDEDITSVTENEEELKKSSKEEMKQSFHTRNNWEKMCIAFCGPFFNYIYAFIVIAAMSLCCGTPNYLPIIEEVQKGSPAEKCGIAPGDRVISVDGKKVLKYRDITNAIADNESKKINFVVKRNGKELSFSLVPEIKEIKRIIGGTKKIRLIGVNSGKLVFERRSFVDSIKIGFSSCISITVDIYRNFAKLFAGKKSIDDFGGVVRMAAVTGDLSKAGSYALLIMFTAILSINLGFINLLPVPVLDGGRILLCLIEEIIRKKLNKTLQERIMILFAVLLIFFMLIMTANDILSIEMVNKFVLSLIR